MVVKTVMTPLTGVILGGGVARRLGGLVKGLIRYRGETLVERMIRQLEPLVDEVVISSSDTLSYGGYGLRLIPDLSPGLGPLGGLQAALAGIKGNLMLAACDLPLIRTEDFSLLLSIAGTGAEHDVVLFSHERGMEPTVGFYSAYCRSAVDQAIARGGRRVISFFDQVRVKVVSHGRGTNPFFNINRPEDLIRLRRMESAGDSGSVCSMPSGKIDTERRGA